MELWLRGAKSGMQVTKEIAISYPSLEDWKGAAMGIAPRTGAISSLRVARSVPSLRECASIGTY